MLRHSEPPSSGGVGRRWQMGWIGLWSDIEPHAGHRDVWCRGEDGISEGVGQGHASRVRVRVVVPVHV